METLIVETEESAVSAPLVATSDENSEPQSGISHSTLKMAVGGQVSPRETEISRSASVLLAVKLLENLSKSAELKAGDSAADMKICCCAIQLIRDHAEYCEQQVGRSGDDCDKNREAELFLERYKSLSLSRKVFHKLPDCAYCRESALESNRNNCEEVASRPPSVTSLHGTPSEGDDVVDAVNQSSQMHGEASSIFGEQTESAVENNQSNCEEIESQAPINTSLHGTPAEGYDAVDAVTQSSELQSKANGEFDEQHCALKEQKQTQLRFIDFKKSNSLAMVVQQEASVCEVAMIPNLEECYGTRLTEPLQNYDRAQVSAPICAYRVIDYCSAKKSGRGWKCDLCLTGMQATETWRCSSCCRDLCTECDSKLHRKSQFANHYRVKLRIIFTRPDLLDQQLHQEALELARNTDFTTKQLAAILVIYAKQVNCKRLSRGFFNSALNWYCCKLLELQEKVAQAVLQLRNCQFSLPVKKIGSILLEMHGNDLHTIMRCANICISLIGQLKSQYTSLHYSQIGYFVSEFDLDTTCESKQSFHQKINQIVVEEFLPQIADFDLAQFVAAQSHPITDGAQVTRCLIAQKFQPTTAPKLLDILKCNRDIEWRTAALQIALDDPSSVLSHPIERLITRCGCCTNWSLECKSAVLPCGCSFCNACLHRMFEQVAQLERIERMSCSVCQRPASDSKSDLQEFQKYADFIVSETLPKLIETLQIQLGEKLQEYDLRVKSLFQCQICTETVEQDQTYVMLICSCKICSNCAAKYFESVIAEKSVVDWGCCICKQPTDSDEKQFEEHIWFLCESLKELLKEETYE